MHGISFSGGAIHIQNLGSFAVWRGLKPSNQTLSQESLAAVCAIPIHNNGNFLEAALLCLLNLDEAPQCSNDCRGQVRTSQFLRALE
jgi:hypothetical protein